MATVSVTAMISQIDNLVLDYIRRRPSFLVPGTNPFWKNCNTTNLIEHWSAPVGNLTLEKIYCHYLTGNCFPCNIAPQKLEVSKYDPKTIEDVPILPVEIVEQVFEFCPVAKLLPFRVLSRTINNIVSNRICQIPAKNVTLDEPGKCVRFVEFLERRIIGLSSIFASYRFGGPCESTLQVLRVVGPWVKFARFEAKDFDSRILSHISNVQVLRFISLPNITENTVTETAKLTKLKRLILGSEFPTKNLGLVTLEHVSLWLQLAPNLRELTSHIEENIEYPHQYLDLFRAHRCLNKIKLTMHSLYRGHKQMKVDVSGYSNTSGELRSVFDAIAVPSHPLNSIPPLTHVTLCGLSGANLGNFVFESVRCLSLSGRHLTNPIVLPTLHINFPRIVALHLDGYLFPTNMNYFASNFSGISTLQLSGYERKDPAPTIHIFDEEILPGNIARWPFSNFRKLKRLEFDCDESLDASLRQTVLGLVRLTIQRLIHPLDQLTITYSPPLRRTHLKVEEVQTLFFSMLSLNYHKHLMFFNRRQPKNYTI